MRKGVEGGLVGGCRGQGLTSDETDSRRRPLAGGGRDGTTGHARRVFVQTLLFLFPFYFVFVFAFVFSFLFFFLLLLLIGDDDDSGGDDETARRFLGDLKRRQ